MRKEPSQSRDYWVEDFKIYGLQKRATSVELGAIEYNYFVLNDFGRHLSVNGVPIGDGMIAGPLPDFAIINIDGVFVLWWGSQEGVEYIPETIEEVGDPSLTY